jgi:Rho GDP-dissociation inhibitor
MADHEDLAANKTEGFKIGEKKTLQEYQQLDANDESLNRWKASLGLNAGTPIADPEDKRKCIIQSLALQTEGRPDITIDLTGEDASRLLKDQPFTVKEGSKFHIKVVFQVHHEVLSGLKYIQIVKRKGIRVSKDQEMLGSYAPSTDVKPTYEKQFNEMEAPSGLISRGHYNAVSRFVDDDDITHLQFEWSFNIAKDW